MKRRMARIQGFRAGLAGTRYVGESHAERMSGIFGKKGIRPIDARRDNVLLHGSPMLAFFNSRLNVRLAPWTGLRIGDLKAANRRTK